MEIDKGDNSSAVRPPQPAKFRWVGLAFWLPACLIEGLLVAWIAVGAQEYFAPFLLFPLLVGVVLGAVTVGLMRLYQIGNRPTILAGTVLAAVVTIAGQHCIGYWQAIEQDRKAQLAFPEELKGRMPGFLDFMTEGRQIDGPAKLGPFHARGAVAWVMWGLDGVLLLAAALTLVLLTSRMPYCERCGSWYRTTRAGRLDAEAAAGLAEMIDVPTPDEPEPVRYRLLACLGGCGPTALEFSRQDAHRGTAPVRIWLQPDQRNRVVRKLDETTRAKGTSN